MNKIPVLFVDDEMIVRVALNSIVNWNATKFKIVGTVSNGEEAIEFINNNPVQLVVTDLKMPNMDGIELVRHLYESHFKGKVIILSSYGEFEYAQQAIRYGVSEYLIKATFNGESLLEAMQKAAKGLIEMKVNEQPNLLTEDEFDEELVRKIIEAPKTVTLGENKVFFSTYCAYYIFKKEKDEKKGTKEMFSSLIQETITKKDCVKLIPISADKTVLIAKDLEEDVFLTKLRNATKMYMNTEVGIIKSNSFSNINEMVYCLTEIQSAKQMVYYKGFNHLILQRTYATYQNRVTKKIKVQIISICRKIYQEDFEGASRAAGQLLQQLLQDKISVKEGKKLIQMLTDTLKLTCGIYFEGQKQTFVEVFEGLEHSLTLEEYETAVRALINAIEESPLKVASQAYRKDVETMIDYINEHLHEKIQVSDVASIVNFTENYISRLFKNEVGINLLSYINLKKMERAMYALFDTDMRIKEIADTLGYEEQSYFNRLFNRFFGKNPSEVQNYFEEIYK